MRAPRPLAPPGLAGTTRRTGRVGYCAQAGRLKSRRRTMRHILAIIACLFVASVAAQEYPVRPVRLIVPIGPGGGTDILGRHMAQKMSERRLAAVVGRNVPGAGSIT